MTAVITLTVTGMVLAVAIGIVTKFFGVKQNPQAEQLLALMPGANCGGCGFAGCADYVEAMVAGRAEPGHCPSMTAEALEAASRILGREIVQAEPKVAVVCCSGDDSHARRRAGYNGIMDCQNALFVAGGGKECLFGCLGLGTCARACPFGAIEMTDRHLAVVHPELCVGCGKCVAACPRHVIRLVSRHAPLVVLCNSTAAAKTKLKACTAACIGCRKCVKGAQEGQMSINGSLAVVNEDNPPEPSLAAVCPTGALHARGQ